MNVAPSVFATLAALADTTAFAGESDEAWEFGITAYPTIVRGGRNYTSAIAVADCGPLHLEPGSTTSRSAPARRSSAGRFPAATQ